MTYTQIENSIYTFLTNTNVLGTTITIIFQNETGERPALPYLGIEINSQTSIGQTYRTNALNVSDQLFNEYDEDFTLELNAYGYGSNDFLKTLKDKLNTYDAIDVLRTSNLVIRDINNPIQDVSFTIDSTQEKRYIYEITMGYRESISSSPSYIQTVQISETINPPN